LNELASKASLYPLVAEVISRDMYVDDLVTGSDNLSDARKLQEIIYGEKVLYYTNGVPIMQISLKVYQNSYESLNLLVNSKAMKVQ